MEADLSIVATSGWRVIGYGSRHPLAYFGINGSGYYSYGLNSDVVTASLGNNNRHEWYINYEDGIYKVDESNITTFTSNQTASAIYSFSLFAYRNPATGAIYASSYKIYNFQISDDGTLVRNFIPAIRVSTSTPGMYDTVNDIFYVNAGTGTFTYG